MTIPQITSSDLSYEEKIAELDKIIESTDDQELIAEANDAKMVLSVENDKGNQEDSE
jgi:hypothetical protein